MTTTVTRLIALSLAVIALAIPSVASAAPQPALGTYHATEQDSVAATPRISRVDSGFDWGDAALGASGLLAVLIIGAGGTLVVRSYRHGHAQVRPS